MADASPPSLADFWAEYRLCMLATPRRDGSIHLVPVGATYDAEAGLVRVIASGTSTKARMLLARPGTRVSLSQVDGRWWTTVEGPATVSRDPERVAEAVRRYAARYREPRPNAERIVIEIVVERTLGNVTA
ncbi:PPOX class F420-dependent oxidoreductase [Agrococcus versicolor]|uniref:PPOX class F420-dependent oxidoreductase n=1 Tax=Agrococcus versicolor TaxID=501482 RepID=A0ABP5MN99_9MICO